ncbi:hypothetical protein [Bosea sp. (in: a-proteobacteria)]|uniref:hypothetical protein n=1 Tax=Bosea sp. (in: a-proteobacteria) TaxID=1871050 RepID=UPI002734914D|nr:hypothetical protein [Bosea sp. (in: a-proteobacteria)]MDP3409035.1 hypothetical protein [Bosea sp. (in: a-proteobacteria)]
MSDFDDLLGSDGPKDASPHADRPDLAGEGDLATFWGVSTRQVRRLLSESVIRKSACGRYSTTDATRGYIQYLITSAKIRGGADPEFKAEKLRLAKEQADHLELRNQEKRGELVSVVTVQNSWAEILRTVRAGMLAVPSRVSARLNLSAHDLEIIDREIRDALTEIGNDARK